MARKVKDSDRVKALQAKTAELNKRYRAEAAKLKAAGVLSSRVNARKNISRATRTKINKFRDVLEGAVTPVRAKPNIREKYDGLIEARGPFLIVPKERAKEKVKIARGLIEIDRPMIGPKGLKFGDEREVILPFKPVDFPQLAERLQTDESLDGLKNGDEMFAMKIDGWATKRGFADAKDMGDYITTHYAHLFKPGNMRSVVKYLTFVRYRNSGEKPATEGPHRGYAFKKPNQRPDKKEMERRREKEAKRKAEQRRRETAEARTKRLNAQRTRSAQNRQRKFLED